MNLQYGLEITCKMQCDTCQQKEAAHTEAKQQMTNSVCRGIRLGLPAEILELVV